MSLGPNATHPAERAIAVTPSDSADLGIDARGLYVGGDGNVAVTMRGGGDVLLAGVLAGTILPVAVKRVLATGTTATSIVALS